MNRPMMHVVDPHTGESDPAEIQRVFDAQLAKSLAWRSSTHAERTARLKKLRDAVLGRREEFYKAFHLDYHKPPSEVEASEIMPVLDEVRHALGDLKKWMKPQRVWPTMLTGGTSAWVEAQPRGRCLIVAPWNYPLNLCFGPLVSALAAGNTVILKPSEMTPHVTAVMASIIRDLFPTDEVAVFEGGLPTSQALLDLPFDHIFFTGSPAVGKVVMAAAAKHLTSVTLELGGKSPVIIDETADIKTAAEVLMWGKLSNCGQTCVAPDHVYVHEAVKDQFVAECRRVVTAAYGSTAIAQMTSPHFTHIINKRHTQRIASLLDDARAKGARILMGGEVDVVSSFVAPTLLDNIPADASIMSEEIFGPVMPVIAWRDIDTVIAQINAQPKPLALYVWSHNKARTRRVVTQTSSGGVGINHCVLHYVHGNLPFGGVNNSGIGSAHGVHGFKAFSHERAVLKAGPVMVAKLFFPPYTGMKVKMIRMVVDSLKLPKLF